MLRVIDQENADAQAWELFAAGAGRQDETFSKYKRRIGVNTLTPLDAPDQASRRERTIRDVQRRLGRFYKSPAIKA